MNLKDRCDNLSKRLQERGVVDVKFHYDRPVTASLSTLVDEVEDIVNAILEGRHKPMAPLGDSQGLRFKMLSPTARCSGGHNGDHYENHQKSGTPSQ